MKRRDLLVLLPAHCCVFVREGGDHSIWTRPSRTSEGIERRCSISEIWQILELRENFGAATVL